MCFYLMSGENLAIYRFWDITVQKVDDWNISPVRQLTFIAEAGRVSVRRLSSD